MRKILIGILSDRVHADMAVDELKNAGYDPANISVITREDIINNQTGGKSKNVAEGIVSGTTTGGVIGGVAGLLVGVGAIAIPGVGGLLVGGPLAAALGLSGAAATTMTGAITGALAGGLVGSLVGLGMGEEEAKVYEQRISEGGTIVAVPLRDETDRDAERVLTKHGATDITHLRGDEK